MGVGVVVETGVAGGVEGLVGEVGLELGVSVGLTVALGGTFSLGGEEVSLRLLVLPPVGTLPKAEGEVTEERPAGVITTTAVGEGILYIPVGLVAF